MADANGLVLDRTRGEIRYRGASAVATPGQFTVIAALAANAGNCVSKNDLYDALYFKLPVKKRPDPKVVDVFVCKLRALLAPLGLVITTHTRRGYELSFPADPAPAAPTPVTAQGSMFP